MKFSVTRLNLRGQGLPFSCCAAWIYALRLTDFLLDMYTFSDVFLNHAACASRGVDLVVLRVGSSVSSSWSSVRLLTSYDGVSGSGSERSNVTDLVGLGQSFHVLTRLAIDSVSSSF